MDILLRATYSLITLYMLLILIRWFSPWLALDVESGRWRWISALTDPLLEGLRRLIPRIGPIDFAPLAAILLTLFLRELLVSIIEGMIQQGAAV